MTEMRLNDTIHRPSCSELSSRSTPSHQPCLLLHYAIWSKIKGNTRGIKKVGTIHGSPKVMSSTSQPWAIYARAACQREPCTPSLKRIEHRDDPDSPCHRDQAGWVEGGWANNQQHNAHDLMMAMPHRDCQCRLSVCSLNVSPANHVTAGRCRSRVKVARWWVQRGRDKRQVASKQAAILRKGDMGWVVVAGAVGPRPWLHNGR